MAKSQKYLFDLDFDAPEPSAGVIDPDLTDPEMAFGEEIIEEELPPPPTFSEEELSLAREQAFEAGRRAGMQEAELATERMMVNTLAAIAGQLQGLAAAQEAANDERLREAVAVALVVLRKLQPEASRLHGLDEIEGVVRECLAQIDRDVRVTIRVNPTHIEGIREAAQRAADDTAFEGKLIYTADPRVAPGDCRIEWGDGGAERDQARIWAEVEATIARALATGPEKQPDAQLHDIAVPA